MSNRRKLPRAVMFGGRDPREVSGPGIVGPGGPRDRGAVLMHAASIVLLARTNVCEVDTRPADAVGEPMETMFALALGGRVNRSPDEVDITFVTNTDGMAALVTELCAVAYRSGLQKEFSADVRRRMADLGVKGALDDMTGAQPDEDTV